jgi:hypothetical protein
MRIGPEPYRRQIMTKNIRSLVCLTAVLALQALVTVPASAEDPRRYEFHEHDVHHFHGHDFERWRGGMWRHEWHNGIYGWWWAVGGMWYFYEQPIYPYPMVVSEQAYPEVIVVQPPPPPVVAAPAPPPAVIQQAPPPPGQPAMWYYCDNPAGYYPYVQTCPTPFRAVPAQPH